MSCYRHFTTKERESLLVLVKQGKKNYEIAEILARSPSTISRELRRNADSRENYSLVQAEERARERRKNSVRKNKLTILHMHILFRVC